MGMESRSPTLPNASSKSKRLSGLSDADKILRQLVTPNNPSVESIRQSIQRSTLESQIKEEVKPRLDFSQLDQKKTPLFLIEMEGYSNLTATMQCLSDKDVSRLADFSRDPSDPNAFPDKILADMTIKKEA